MISIKSIKNSDSIDYIAYLNHLAKLVFKGLCKLFDNEDKLTIDLSIKLTLEMFYF